MNLTKLLHTGSEKTDQYLLRMYNQSKDITGSFSAKAPAADGTKEGLAARAARAVKGVGLEIVCRAERAAAFILLAIAVAPQVFFLPIAFVASASHVVKSNPVSRFALAYLTLVHKELCILGELLPSMLSPAFKPTFILANAVTIAKKVTPKEQYQIFSSMAWRSSYASYKQAKLLQSHYVGVPTDHYKTKEIFKKLALKGNAKAHYHLGINYQYDVVFQKNLEKSYDHLKAASDLHLAKATRKLAEDFYYGDFVTSGEQNAQKFYEKAAAQGDLPSQYKLAIDKANNPDKTICKQGVKQLEAILAWGSIKALNAADVLIMFYTGKTGVLVTEDNKSALENRAVELARKLQWKNFSIKESHSHYLDQFKLTGARHLVDIYEKRLEQLKTDPTANKHEWPQMLADLNEAANYCNHASYLLGRIHAEGIMVEKDLKLAAEHLKKAAQAKGLSFNNPRGFAAYQLLREIEHPVARRIPIANWFI